VASASKKPVKTAGACSLVVESVAMTEGTLVLSVFAYNVAQLPELLPRKPAKEKKADQ
jgi:hypothetical protein